jgi:hypothetical protein
MGPRDVSSEINWLNTMQGLRAAKQALTLRMLTPSLHHRVVAALSLHRFRTGVALLSDGYPFIRKATPPGITIRGIADQRPSPKFIDYGWVKIGREWSGQHYLHIDMRSVWRATHAVPTANSYAGVRRAI